jgi:hypothetical protein
MTTHPAENPYESPALPLGDQGEPLEAVEVDAYHDEPLANAPSVSRLLAKLRVWMSLAAIVTALLTFLSVYQLYVAVVAYRDMVELEGRNLTYFVLPPLLFGVLNGVICVQLLRTVARLKDAEVNPTFGAFATAIDAQARLWRTIGLGAVVYFAASAGATWWYYAQIEAYEAANQFNLDGAAK